MWLKMESFFIFCRPWRPSLLKKVGLKGNARLSYSPTLSLLMSLSGCLPPSLPRISTQKSRRCIRVFFLQCSVPVVQTHAVSPPPAPVTHPLLLLVFWPAARRAVFRQKCTGGFWLRIRQGFWCRCGCCIVFKSTGWRRWHGSLSARLLTYSIESRDGPLRALAFHTSELHAWRPV